MTRMSHAWRQVVVVGALVWWAGFAFDAPAYFVGWTGVGLPQEAPGPSMGGGASQDPVPGPGRIDGPSSGGEFELTRGIRVDCNSNGTPDDTDIAYQPDVFAVAGDSAGLYKVNTATGALTWVALMRTPGVPIYEDVEAAYGLSAHPQTNELYAVVSYWEEDRTRTSPRADNRFLVRVDQATAEVTVIGALGQPLADIAFRRDGRLYGIKDNMADVPGQVVWVDPTSAALTSTGIVRGAGSGQAIAFQRATGLLYHAYEPLAGRAPSGAGDGTGSAHPLVVVPTGSQTASGEVGVMPASTVESGRPLQPLEPAPRVEERQVRVLAAINVDTGTVRVVNGSMTAGPFNAMVFAHTGDPIYGYAYGAYHLINPRVGTTTYVGTYGDAVTGLAILSGGSLDCDENGVPDECDIATGASPDCNYNAVPDECDVARPQTVLQFDGSNDFVRVAMNMPENNCTVSLWFKTTCTQCGLFSVMENILGGGNDRHLYLSSGNIWDRIYSNESIQTSGTNFADGQWHHLVFVYGTSTGGQRIYVDGQQRATGSKASSDFNWDHYVHVGYSVDAGQDFLNGAMQTVAIWNVVLSPAEIGTLYAGGLPQPGNLIGHWTFDEDLPEQTLVDHSGQGNHGTLGASASPGGDDPVRLLLTAGGTSEDCNGNGVPDECDLAAGSSPDCNGNDIPDECDIAAESSPDCNTNGIPDECDLASGASEDCQPDGTPDECQLKSAGVYFLSGHTADFGYATTNWYCGRIINNSLEWVWPTYAHSGTILLVWDNGAWYDSWRNALNSRGIPYTQKYGTQVTTADFIPGVWSMIVITEYMNNGSLATMNSLVPAMETYVKSGGVLIDMIATNNTRRWSQGTPGPFGTVTNSTNGSYSYIVAVGHGMVTGMPLPYISGNSDHHSQIVTRPTGSTVILSAGTTPGGLPTACWLEFTGSGDCNHNGTPDNCDISAGTSDDCNDNDIPDECDITNGYSADANTNGMPDECEVDCNGNGVPDPWDLQEGTSHDCNHNGTPDECERDCNDNGFDDACDVTAGTSHDCNNSGTPDECERDCNTNGYADECDIAAGSSNDCNNNNTPDECQADCNRNRLADSCDIAAGTSEDCNANGTPDECEPDCNTNGVADPCDITAHTSEDCNNNTTPDECDIARGVSRDLNGNGIPDECENDCNNNDVPDDWDIAQGTSRDCNTNGMPDECETDCNNNDTPDDCDLAAGTSHDCNANAVPDECEQDCNDNGLADACDIAAGTSHDCNNNGTPDECQNDCNENGYDDTCDLAAGTSADCQPNGMPDECDLDGGGTRIADPDDFPAGTIVDTAWPRVVLSAVTSPTGGPYGDGHVYVRSGPYVSTGTRMFGNSGNTGIGDVWCGGPSLRATFSRPTSYVSLDAIGDDSSETSTMNAYSSQGALLSSVVVYPNGAGAVRTMTITRPTADIAYVVAWGVCNNLDHLVFGGGSEDCNSNGVPDECDIAQGTSTDVNANGTPDDCEPDCNSNGISDLIELAAGQGTDCDDNLVLDACQIAAGTSRDCNANDLPDACDITAGTSLDCNHNTFPDECDLAQGTSQDVNTNGRPDECEVAPVAVPGGPYTFNAAMNPITLNAQGSYDPDGTQGGFADIVAVQWDLGNDGIADDTGRTLPLQPLTWSEARAKGLRIGGPVALKLTVMDVDDHSGSAVTQITYQNTAPTAQAAGPYGPIAWGQGVTFAGVVNDADLAVGPGFETLTVEWDTSAAWYAGQVGNGFANQANATVSYETLYALWGSAGVKTVYLNVKDSGGAVASASTTLELLAPDLQLTTCSAPAEFAAGQWIEVSWRVTNLGPSGALGTWADRVYLSNDQVVGGDIQVGSFNHTGPLAVGAFYDRTEYVLVPGNLAGQYWVIVITDAANAVQEGGAEGNNASICGGGSISDTLNPETSIVSGPADGSPINTTQVTFTWTGSDNSTPVANLVYSYCLAPVATGCDPTGGPFGSGTSATFTDLTVADSPYVFKVAAQDLAGNVDTTPAQRTFRLDQTAPAVSGHTPSGAAHDVVCAVQVTFTEAVAGFTPADVTLTGPSGAIAVTQVVGTTNPVVMEFRFACQRQAGTYNFTIGTGITDLAGNPLAQGYSGSFSIALADLAPIVVDIPSNGVSGSQIAVTWTVTNHGTYQAGGSWKDGVYLSSDAAWGNDTLLGEFTFSGPVAAGASYERTQNVTLPALVQGNYWIIVLADSRSNLPEHNEGDNVLVSSRSMAIVIQDLPDFVVTEVSGPTSGFAGQQVTLYWTVTNNGTGGTGGAVWSDAVYLSLNRTIDGPDYLLGRFENPSSLMPGESYLQTQTVTIPDGLLNCFFFVVRADSLNQVLEYRAGVTAEANNDNATTSCTTISLPPPADLQVTSVSAPASGFSGQNITIIWEVTNLGTSPTQVGSWQDSLYVSTDEVLNASDSRICSVPHNGVLNAGGSYTQTSACKLPRWIEGNYYVFVLADSANQVAEQGFEGNNSAYDETAMNVMLSPPPDLEVVDVSVTGVTTPDGLFTVQWTVANYGAGATEESAWKDYVYLSTDNSLATTADNVKLGEKNRSGALGSGQSYAASLQVNEPACLAGTRYVFVVTDAADQVEEYYANYENNNTSVPEPVNFVADEPELAVTAVDAPSNGFSGQMITVGWEVTNLNTSGVNASGFADAVYLSTNTTLETTGDTLLGTFPYAGVVPPGGSYAVTTDVRVPVGLATGMYYVFVLTDAENKVFECSSANNAAYDPVPMHVDFTEPDLLVSDITMPSQGYSGQGLSVEWTVVNAGDRATDVANWTDTVYLSTDATLVTQGSQADTVLGTFDHAGALGVLEEYQRTEVVTLPPATVGTYYLFVCTDTGAKVVEPGGETNNCNMRQLNVTATEPDLAVTAVTGPNVGESGQAVQVSWTVENLGERGTTQTTWVDSVYISEDQALGASDRKLASFTHQGTLDAAASYQASGTVTLSVPHSGSFFILVKADADGLVYELGREANNVGADPAGIAVTCTLDPDLTVTNTVGPITANSGQKIDVTWTVSNLGSRTTPVSGWTDTVYLSGDPELTPATDLSLGDFVYSTTLGIGQSYTRTVQVTLPNGISGPHYLYVFTDRTDKLSECGHEDNNLSAPPVIVTIGLTAVDLQITAVPTPALGYAGQEIALSWTVSNLGSSPISGLTWRDNAYLSQDLNLDPETDPSLGFVTHKDPVGPGVSYEVSANLPIPLNTVPGDYYVLVVTDSAGAVYEHNAETNNLSASAATFPVEAPLPADLVVTAVVAPLTAAPGQKATFQWTVTNQGVNSAVGSWFDALYVSEDAVWDLYDPLVGKIKHTGTVPAGTGAYTGSAMLLVPGVLPVPHYVIVRTDINNNVPEQTAGEANNMGVSGVPIDMQIPELTLGVPASGQLASSGAAHYYRVTASGEETLRVTLDGTAGANELYIRYNLIPDRGHFDDSHENPFLPDQQVFIPTTQAGTYYIVVYGDYVPNPPQNYTILAEALPFSIAEIRPSAAGNTAFVTVEIIGARLHQDADFSLTTADDQALDPTALYPQDRSSVFATFDLQGATPGMADMTATNPDGARTTRANGLEVLDGGGPALNGRIIAPGAVRGGWPFTTTIEYGNAGSTDIAAPILELRANRVLYVSLNPDGPYTPTPLRFVGVNFHGPAGILPPGGYGKVIVYVQGTADGSILQGLVQRTAEDLLNWSEYEAKVRPAGLSDPEWAELWTTVTSRIGNTWGGLEQVLARNATRLWQEGRLVNDVVELLKYDLSQAGPSQANGLILDADTGAPMPDVEIRAWSDMDADGSADAFYEMTSDDNGLFSLEVTGGGGIFQFFAVGYVVDPPVIVDMSPTATIGDVVLYAHPEPPPYDPPVVYPELPDRSPKLARDGNGAIHMTWTRDNQPWHAQYSGTDWAITGQVNDHTALSPRLAAGPAGVDPGAVTLLWVEGDGDAAELYYAVGRPDDMASNGFGWSQPIAVTQDTYTDQLPVLLLSNNDEVMVLFLKKDSSIQDDTDVYYFFEPVGTLDWSPPRTERIDILPIIVEDLVPDRIHPDSPFFAGDNVLYYRGGSVCGKVELGSDSFIRKLPLIGGPYGFKVSGELCADFSICDPSISGEVSGACKVDEHRKFTVKLAGDAKWKTNKEKCKYEFDKASFSAGGSGSLSFKVNDIPAGRVITWIGRIFWIKWELGVKFSASVGGKVVWKKDFPGWPDEGKITFSLSGGPYGKVSLTDAIEANVSGVLQVKGEWVIPGYPTITGVCIKVSADVDTYFLTWQWEYEYPENCGAGPKSMGRPALPPGAYLIDFADPLRDEPYVDQITIVVNPKVGTGNQYPGLTVQPDVSGDLANDQAPALASTLTGGFLAAWPKDSPDPNTRLGSSIVVSEYANGSWSAREAVIDDTDFNSTPAVVVDSTGVPMLVWSRSSAAGLTLSSTVEEIMAAIANSDLMYSRRVGGVWTAPAILASLPGGDTGAALAADAAGRVLAVWINGDDATQVTHVYASLWDGSAWSVPVQVSTTGFAFDSDVEFETDGRALAVWSADADGNLEDTPEDLTIYSATFDGSWSTPRTLPKEAGRSEGRATLGEERISLPDPPIPMCCCKTDSDCDDQDDCTEDKCEKGECKNKNLQCDDHKVCTKDKCDTQGGCQYEPIDCNDHNNCTTDSCVEPTGCKHDSIDCGQSDECTARWCSPSLGCQSASLDCCKNCPPVWTPRDPNAKVGPNSYGPEGWIAADQPLLYTILFENVPEATAAAQIVTVTDQLSSDLDWRTFRVRDLGWGSELVEVPDNRSFYQADVPYANTNGYLVRVVAAVDVQSGEATWTLTTIDPRTGELPEDQTAGFLPPNIKELHNGEGFVSYTVQPLRNIETGTVITNQATIVFDTLEAIDTNEVFNTIDGDPPSSAVVPLAPLYEQTGFTVSWAGEDAAGGSGLASYSVYVAIDDGPFQPFAQNTTETSAVFTGEPGHTFSFYCVAEDNVGNLEQVPEVPDTATFLREPPSGQLLLRTSGDTGCVAETFTVNLNVAALTDPINGVQALMHYDTEFLTLTGITPQGAWSEVYELDDNGDVTYVVFMPSDSTTADGTVATLTFQIIGGAEGTGSVGFRPDGGVFKTKLTRSTDNLTILPEKSDAGNVVLDGTVPVVSVEAFTPDPAKAGAYTVTVHAADANLDAPADWTVTVTDGGGNTNTIAHTVPVLQSGDTYTFQMTIPSGLSDTVDGLASIAVAVGDCAGHVQSPPAMPFHVDTQPPVLSGLSLTQDGQVVVAGNEAYRTTLVDSCAPGGTRSLPVLLAFGVSDPERNGYASGLAGDPAVGVTDAASQPIAGSLSGGYVYTLTLGGTTANGVASYTVNVSDLAGNLASGVGGTFPVNVTQVVASVDLQAVSHAVEREVEFVLTDCEGAPDTQTWTRTLCTDATGLGTTTLLRVDYTKTWDALTAREGHTLRQLLDTVTFTAQSAPAAFSGVEQLTAGDLHTVAVPQDNLVDITDFSILASRWNLPVGDCDAGVLPANCGMGADMTGDGAQDTADFTAIQINYFRVGDAENGCSRTAPAGLPGSAVAGAVPRGHVAVAELKSRMPDADQADVTGDGVIDAKDIRAFARQHSLTLLPGFQAKLSELEAREGQVTPAGPGR